MVNKKDALTDVVQTLRQPNQPVQPSQPLKPSQVVNQNGQIIQLGQNNLSTK